jgi:bifunctional non-homologous end joining protein LigD
MTGRIGSRSSPKAAQKLRGSFLIDGEAVVVGPDGLSLFDQLQSTAGRARAVLFAFDLIQLDGQDHRARPLLERKALLAKLLARTDQGILYNDHTWPKAAMLYSPMPALGAAGIVSKRIDSSLPRANQGETAATIRMRMRRS